MNVGSHPVTGIRQTPRQDQACGSEPIPEPGEKRLRHKCAPGAMAIGAKIRRPIGPLLAAWQRKTKSQPAIQSPRPQAPQPHIINSGAPAMRPRPIQFCAGRGLVGQHPVRINRAYNCRDHPLGGHHTTATTSTTPSNSCSVFNGFRVLLSISRFAAGRCLNIVFRPL